MKNYEEYSSQEHKELKEYQYTQKWQEIGLPFEEVKDYLRNFKGVYSIDGEVYSGMESGGEVIVHEDGMRTIMSELIMIWDEKYIPDNCEANREKISAKKKAYYKDNTEKIKEYKKQYRAKKKSESL